MLDVMESVLCGSLNKALVRALLRRSVNAAGISGQNGETFVAQPASLVADVSLGYIGDQAGGAVALVDVS